MKFHSTRISLQRLKAFRPYIYSRRCLRYYLHKSSPDSNCIVTQLNCKRQMTVVVVTEWVHMEGLNRRVAELVERLLLLVCVKAKTVFADFLTLI